jgi:hypothetical protein
MRLPPPSRRSLALIAVLVGASLRLLHAPQRWEEVAWLYSAYPGATLDALAAGRWAEGLTRWTGLHPPLWSLWQAALEALSPRPVLWIALSALLSTLGVRMLARRSPGAALLLAGGAAQVHYSAELNSYPLLCAGVAGLWAAIDGGQPRGDGGPPGALRGGLRGGAVALALCWTHALGALTALGWALRPAPGRARRLGLLAIGASPLLPGALGRLVDGGSFKQPPLKPALMAADLFDRFGGFGVLCAILALVGGGLRCAGAPVTLPALGLLALLLAGAAAPHQWGTLLVFGPPVALGAAGALKRWPWAVVALGAAQAVAVARVELHGLGALWQARSGPEVAAVEGALAALGPGFTCGPARPTLACAGDALVILRPAPRNDDDKRRHSAALWALGPWGPLPRARPSWGAEGPLPHEDHRLGQPRLRCAPPRDSRGPAVAPARCHVVYVHDAPRPHLEGLLALHPAVQLVVLDPADRPALQRGLRRTLAAQGPLQVEGPPAAARWSWGPAAADGARPPDG